MIEYLSVLILFNVLSNWLFSTFMFHVELWTRTNAVHPNTLGVSPFEVLKCGWKLLSIFAGLLLSNIREGILFIMYVVV